MAVFMTVGTGCASTPSYRISPDLPQGYRAIRTMGLLPPRVSLYEEQYRFGLNNIVPREDWSRAAVETLQKSFLDEASAIRMPLTVIKNDDSDVGDVLDLFGAVDLSIQKHAYESESGAFPPREPFPEKLRSFDYSLGPLQGMMERHQVEAIWIVIGVNLLPTAGAQWGDAGQTLIAILAAMGGAPVGTLTLKKIELRAALVDKSGKILFYTRLDESNVPQVKQTPGGYNVLQGGYSTDQGPEQGQIEKDIREPRFARRYIRELLSEYQTEAAR